MAQDSLLLNLPYEVIYHILTYLPSYAQICLLRSCKHFSNFPGPAIDADNAWKLKHLYEFQKAINEEALARKLRLACSGCLASHDRPEFTEREAAKGPYERLCLFRSQGVFADKSQSTNFDTVRLDLLLDDQRKYGRWLNTSAAHARQLLKVSQTGKRDIDSKIGSRCYSLFKDCPLQPSAKLVDLGYTRATVFWNPNTSPATSVVYPSNSTTYARTLTLQLQRCHGVSVEAANILTDHFAIQDFRFRHCPHQKEYTAQLLRKHFANVNLDKHMAISSSESERTFECKTCGAHLRVSVHKAAYQLNCEVRIVGTYGLGDMVDHEQHWRRYLEADAPATTERLKRKEEKQLRKIGIEHPTTSMDARLCFEALFRHGARAAVQQVNRLWAEKSKE